MSDLLMNVSLARKSLQKKRQLRSKDLSLNFGSLISVDVDRSKTERNLRLRSQDKSLNSEILVTSPVPPRRFEFQESVNSPTRLHSYKLDATGLLFGRISRFLNKHFLIWKKKAEALKNRELELFKKQAKKLKVNVGRVDKGREILVPDFAGKIIRKSQDFGGKIVSNLPSSLVALSDEDGPLIGSGFEARRSRDVSNDKIKFQIIDKGVKSPRYVMNDEEAGKKLENILRKLWVKEGKIVMSLIKGMERGNRVRSKMEKIQKIKNSFNVGLPEEASSPSIYGGDSRRNSKQVFEGCLKNLKDFISDKRGKIKGKNIFLQDLQDFSVPALKIVDLLDRVFKRTAFESLLSNERESDSDSFVNEFINPRLSDSGQKSEESLITTQNREKILKNLLKNLNRDKYYRIKACLQYWRMVIRSDIKNQEEFSLSAVTIHNILLNIINCRTKYFFTTYKLALIKYREQNQERFKNYSKAVNRLSLCIRNYKLKPFLTWKYSDSSSQLKLCKKNLFRLERSIKELVYQPLQHGFSSILQRAKYRSLILRTLNRVFLKSLQKNFQLFKSELIYNYKNKNLFIGSSKSFALNMKNMKNYLKNAPTKFSFKYLCRTLNRLGTNLSFHYKSLKKNTMIKWKLICNHHNKLISMKKKYEKEVSHALATGALFNKLNMVYMTIIRLSFMRLRKVEY